MKKFKNKNTGEIVSQYNETHYQDNSDTLVHKRFIVNSCDWEEVKEKEYEVLSLSYFSEFSPFAIYDETKDGEKYSNKDNKNHVLLRYVGSERTHEKDVKIHSVKRLLDGEVFTVGDEVTWGVEKESDFRINIKSFYIKNEKLMVTFSNSIYDGISICAPNFRKIEYPLFYDDLKNGEYYVTTYPNQGIYIFKQGYKLWRNNSDRIHTSCDGRFVPSNGFNKFRKATKEEIKVLAPLFTTEDGVEIFEGSTYYIVNTTPHLWSLFEQTAKERTKLNKGCKAFSTKELAEEFLLMSKPLISLSDLLYRIDEKAWLCFEELAKSKLG